MEEPNDPSKTGAWVIKSPAMDDPLVKRKKDLLGKENPLHFGHITEVDGRSRENITADSGNAARTLN